MCCLSAEHVDFRISTLEKKLKDLKRFKFSFPGTHDEWVGSAFLKENQLLAYTKGLVASQLDMKIWPLEFIDWGKAVEDIKEKLNSVILDDVKYWIVENTKSSTPITDIKGAPEGDDFIEVEFGDPEFVLVLDNDCHWFVIPYKNLKDWSTWASDDCPVMPDWAISVGGSPALVVFKEHRIL